MPKARVVISDGCLSVYVLGVVLLTLIVLTRCLRHGATIYLIELRLAEGQGLRARATAEGILREGAI